MFYIGIDVGGTKIAAGIVDESGNLIVKEKIETQREKKGEAIVEDMAGLAIRVAAKAGLSLGEIQGVGIGIPAMISADRKTVYRCHYVAIDGMNLSEALQRHLKLPVYIDNDGNAAAWAEHMAGSAKGASDSITITLGTGIGGGIVINNRIFRGFNGMAGEIGHMVVHTKGHTCVCGRKGCWEEYASASALVREAKAAMKKTPESLISSLAEYNPNKMNAIIPFQAARSGDPASINVIQNYIANLSAGIANLVVIFQPEYLCIGGGISNEGESLIEPIRNYVLKEVYRGMDLPKTQIVHTHFFNDAGIIGAALLCMK